MTFRGKGPMERSRCHCGDHIWTNLTKGFVLMISPEDEEILDHNWSLGFSRKARLYVCAQRMKRKDGGGHHSVSIHRALAKPDLGMVVDHANMNSLDNRRENIRVCTPQQNLLNRPAYRGKKVPLKGVQLDKHSGRYKAVIRFNNRWQYLGIYDTPEEAHEAYAAKARELHGEFFRAE